MVINDVPSIFNLCDNFRIKFGYKLQMHDIPRKMFNERGQEPNVGKKVTRCIDYLLNIWTVTTMKICPIA